MEIERFTLNLGGFNFFLKYFHNQSIIEPYTYTNIYGFDIRS